jgi:hypothetical protein
MSAPRMPHVDDLRDAFGLSGKGHIYSRVTGRSMTVRPDPGSPLGWVELDGVALTTSTVAHVIKTGRYPPGARAYSVANMLPDMQRRFDDVRIAEMARTATKGTAA